MSIYDHMRGNGIQYSGEFVKDGRCHRFTADNDKKKDQGWYYYHADRPENCVYGHFREHGPKTKFIWNANTRLSPEDEAVTKRRVEAARKARARDLEQKHRSARERAEGLWTSGQPVIHHEYLNRKGVKAHGILSKRQWLMVPMRTLDGTLRGLQWILPDGQKRFLAGTEKAGACHQIGEVVSRLIICEGYATGASIFEATGHAVLVAFDSGNLMPVVADAVKTFPNVEILIAGDDDFARPENIGRISADACGIQYELSVIYPKFSANERGTDFNDLATLEGLEAIKEQFDRFEKTAKKPLSLQRDQRHNILCNANNVVRILESIGGPVHDRFTESIFNGDGKRWTDADDMKLQIRIQENFIPEISMSAVRTGATVYSRKHSRNFVHEFIESTVWDDIDRIDQFMPLIFGCEDNEYTRAVSANFWIALIARAYEPGCKFDNMIVLEGLQGIMKSSALETIGGDWYQSLGQEFGTKDFFMALNGKWLVEIGELQSFGKADILTIKNVLSTRVDTYRPSHGMRVLDIPRHCVMVGTTNAESYLKDDTGGRRFWPIKCKFVDIEEIRRIRTQLFAEALVKYRRGAKWWEVPKDLAEAEQADRLQEDPWLNAVARYVHKNRHNKGFRPDEILTDSEINLELSKITPQIKSRVISCLKHLGFGITTVNLSGRRVSLWADKGGRKSGQLKFADSEPKD